MLEWELYREGGMVPGLARPLFSIGYLCDGEGQPPCCKDAQAVFWGVPRGRELRLPASGYMKASFWTRFFEPKSSLQIAGFSPLSVPEIPVNHCTAS